MAGVTAAAAGINTIGTAATAFATNALVTFATKGAVAIVAQLTFRASWTATVPAATVIAALSTALTTASTVRQNAPYAVSRSGTSQMRISNHWSTNGSRAHCTAARRRTLRPIQASLSPGFSSRERGAIYI